MTSQDEHVLLDLIRECRWDDVMERMQTEKGREELRRKRYGPFPLHAACIGDAPFELVEAMVDEYPEGVKVTMVGGSIPLHAECGKPFDDPCPWVVRLLLDAYPKGAKTADNVGWLPLHRAAFRKAPLEVLVMLIDAHPEGAAACDEDGRLPLHYVADKASPDEKEDAEKVELLFRPLLDNEGACLVSDPQSGDTPLHIAAKFDLLSLRTCVPIPLCPPEVMLKVAQHHPAKLRQRDESGNLPLHIVAANPNLNGVQVECEDLICKLVKLYPDAAAASDGERRFPLILAIESGKTWQEGIEAIADAAKHVVPIRDEGTNLYAFMLAACGENPCVTTVYSLLRRCPELKRYALN